MKIIEKKLSEIRPYQNNPRRNEPAVDAVCASLREFGFKQPIVIDKDGEIVAGHTRFLAAKRLGFETVPVVIADDLTEEQIKAYRLADNKTAEFADWDIEALDLELLEIADIDMERFGFDMEAVAAGVDEVQEDQYDFDNEQAEEKVQRGQVWVLGNHRLMCGDSSSKEDQKILMGGAQPKLVFTDPPYGVAIGDKNKMLDEVAGGKSGRIKTNIENDTLGTDDLYNLLLKAFTALRENCAEDCSYYVTSPQGGEIGLMMMMMMMRDAGLEVRHNLIWEKSSATFSMGRLDYDYKHEPIFYTWTKKHHFYGNGECKNTVWQFPKPRKCDLHPTMKPVELVAECIKNSSKKGDVVCDIFGGSGTTLIACEQLDRQCFMMELDPHYCDVIIDRWEKMTGDKAKMKAGTEIPA